jgi:hypothetical protein
MGVNKAICQDKRRYLCDGGSEGTDDDHIVVVLGDDFGFGSSSDGGSELCETLRCGCHCCCGSVRRV